MANGRGHSDSAAREIQAIAFAASSYHELDMPYERNTDLPANLQRLLPEHAQSTYREAFNHAYAAHSGETRREESAHRIAWAAVKRAYVKTSAGSLPREEIG